MQNLLTYSRRDSRLVNWSIVLLIVISLFGVILESVPDLKAQYALAFSTIEIVALVVFFGYVVLIAGRLDTILEVPGPRVLIPAIPLLAVPHAVGCRSATWATRPRPPAPSP